MLGKCANPPCSAPFRRLGDGRLFRLEPDPTLRLSNPKTEYFWLCPTCSAEMTLRIDGSGTVVTAPFPVSVHDEYANVVPLSVGQSGLLLRKVDSPVRQDDVRGIARHGKRHAMPDDWEQREDLIAAGTRCPMPDCGALTLAYRPTDYGGRDNSEPWEFTCPRCGVEFTVAECDLIFQSVPKDWLLAEVHSA